MSRGPLACQRADWADPQVIETLSKIREQQGRMAEAVALQRRAVAVSGGTEQYATRLKQLVLAN